jgi:hypothetical protein
MLQITEFTEARLATLTNRVEKHGDDEKPAVTLGIELTMANTILDTIDPTLRSTLFKAKSDGEPELPGMEAHTPVLRCNSIDRVTLPTKHEGWTLQVDDGIDDTDPMTFGGCKVDKVSVEPKQGGSIVLRMRVGTSDVDAERLGQLGMHNGQSIWVQLRKPEKAADEPAIDGTTEAFERDHPGAATATDLFVAGEPGMDDGPEEGTDGEGSDTDAGAAQAQAEADRGTEGWPFPRGGAQTDGQVAEARDAEREAGPTADAPAKRRGRAKAAA